MILQRLDGKVGRVRKRQFGLTNFIYVLHISQVDDNLVTILQGLQCREWIIQTVGISDVRWSTTFLIGIQRKTHP